MSPLAGWVLLSQLSYPDVTVASAATRDRTPPSTIGFFPQLGQSSAQGLCGLVFLGDTCTFIEKLAIVRYYN